MPEPVTDGLVEAEAEGEREAEAVGELVLVLAPVALGDAETVGVPSSDPVADCSGEPEPDCVAEPVADAVGVPREALALPDGDTWPVGEADEVPLVGPEGVEVPLSSAVAVGLGVSNEEPE